MHLAVRKVATSRIALTKGRERMRKENLRRGKARERIPQAREKEKIKEKDTVRSQNRVHVVGHAESAVTDKEIARGSQRATDP